VLAMALLWVAWGVFALVRLPFDAFPDTTPVQVHVNTSAPGLGPEEVERQITQPLELQLRGIPGLLELRSISRFGFSQLTLVFEDDVGVYRGRQMVAERLPTASLPASAHPPALGPVTTGLGEIFQYVLRSDRHTATELRTLHDWVVRPQLLGVAGVAEVNTWGGFERQLHVVIDPARLVSYDLALTEVAEALRRDNTNVAGAVLVSGGEAELVQGVGLATTLDDIRQIVVVTRHGVPVRIGDLGRVEEGHEPRRGAVTANGEGEVVLGLAYMTMGENTREVTEALEARLARAQRTLPEGVEVEPLYSRSKLVDAVLHTVQDNLLIGALLVISVLFALMGNLRAGLIVAMAIPMSMLFAFDLMLQFGVAGSLMSLGALDFGLVVDSSVIMVENVERRLSEAPADADGLSIVRDAALEVRRPTLFGELVIAAVYLPILALEGVEGKLFRPMALTVIFALMGSMVLSMTLVPVLASFGLGKRSGLRPPWLARMLAVMYRPVLRTALEHRLKVLVIAALAVASAGVLAPRLGTEFVPRLREQAIAINTVRLASVSLDESVRYGHQLELRLKDAFPDEIEHIWTRTGSAEVATDPMGVELSDIFITLTPREQWRRADNQDQLVRQMSEVLSDMPGMRAIFTQPIEMRVNEMLAGIRADVGVELQGDDFAQLDAAAERIRAVVASIHGAEDVSVGQTTGLPIRRIVLDRGALGRHGIPAAEVLAMVEATGAMHVGEVQEGQRRVDLMLRLDETASASPEALASLLVRAPSGEQVPLSELAHIERAEGPAAIERQDGRRRVIIQANVRDRDVGSFVAELRERVDAEVALPPGYVVNLGGSFEQMERAQRRLMFVVPLALLVVLALLYVTYNNPWDVLRVFTGVPFAAVGGILALWAREMPLSISALVGFVALSGVAVLGDMVMVSRVRQLLAAGLAPMHAITQAAETRLRPVLMTALVAALGFLPMALNTGVGGEVQRPLATVVIGGMVSSTLATLLVLPVLYLTFRSARRRLDV